MAIHILRDFFTPTTTLPSSSMYYTSIFLFHVLQFTQVGQTNFDLSGSLLVASGLSASINFGVTGSFSTVGIPTASYLVGAADVNRILALRSALFPRFNSGLFRITSVVTASNRLNIEYRSTDDPPVETGSLGWGIFTNENLVQGNQPYQNTGATPNGPGGYKSRGSGYTGKRIVLQSPHTSSWQLRMCQESSQDRANFLAEYTIAPGFGGDSFGDFPSRSLDSTVNVEHLHGPMFFDKTSGSQANSYQGSCVALSPNVAPFSNPDVSNAQIRYYGWGDDVTGSCVFMYRNVTGYSDGWFAFGMSEDDEPAPPRTSQKLFAFGRANSTTQDVRWHNGVAFAFFNSAVAFGLNRQPVNCVLSLYDYTGSPDGNGPIGESNASDNALLGASELQKVDLWAGTAESGYDRNQNWPATAVLQYDPRRMGSMPLARAGRSNFGTWSLSTDASKTWFHGKGGVFLPWAGPGIFL